MTIASDYYKFTTKTRWAMPLVSATESLVLIGGVLVLELLGVDYEALPISPYLVCVILMAAQHGLVGGVFSATLATVLTHLGAWPTPGLGESYFDFMLDVWSEPLVWLATGLGVGMITTRRIRNQARTADALDRALTAQALIEHQYNILATRTRKLERRIAGLDGEDEAAKVPKRHLGKSRPLQRGATDRNVES
jgi:hypothetical protein